ncbi:MAG: glycoside hydrolase family 130 protein [Phycisphaeraceae bacterium]
MPERLSCQRMLGPEDLPASDPRMRVVGVFNPGVATLGDETILLVRVVEQPIEQREGARPSPRYDPGAGLTIDWLPAGGLTFDDPRVYRDRVTGFERLRFISHLKVVRSRDGSTVSDAVPGAAVFPATAYEAYGIEDPRITRIGDAYYITYVGVSPHGLATCLMSTRNFTTFRRHGIILPPENKDVLLFPERVRGDYVAMHRPVPSMQFRAPEMWIAHSPDLLHWGRHEHLLGATRVWERSRIGGGTPPIRAPEGWLTLYHGSERREGDPGPGVYTAGGLLLELDDPRRVLAQTREPVMRPTQSWERRGFVDEVVFPTGLVERGEELWVYYGAADESVAVAVFDRERIMATMMDVT